LKRAASFLLAGALCSATASSALAQTAGTEEISAVIDKGMEFLIKDQNADGSWGGTGNQTFTSGFGNRATYKCWQIGASALSTRSLMELGGTKEELQAADRGIDFLIANAKVVRPAQWDVDNNWAIIYNLDTISRALQNKRYLGTPREAKLREAGKVLLGGMAKYQSPNGGWGYYANANAAWRPEWATSFMTAVGVISLVEAKEAGLPVDEKMFKTGVKALEMSHLPNGAFNYGVQIIPRHQRLESINNVRGSLGRIQVGHLALWRAGGKVDMKQIEWGLEQFLKHGKFLEVARNKPIPHEAYYANAAYFYLFGHYYAAQTLQLLPKEKRAKFAPYIQAGFMRCAQENGSMWDFWIADSTKPYGTSFGIMGLERTLTELK
jgi:hypothetical protein